MFLQPTKNTYGYLNASNVLEGGTFKDAELFIGDEGSITLDVDNGEDPPPEFAPSFAICPSAYTNGALTMNLPDSMISVNVRGNQSLTLGGRIVGDGSITFQPINPSQPEANVYFYSDDFLNFLPHDDIEPANSSFTGGITINPKMRVTTNFSSKLDGSGNFVSGPFGMGTVQLSGGTLSLNPYDPLTTVSIILKNAIKLNTNSEITGSIDFATGKKAVLGGAISLSGYELRLAKDWRVHFDAGSSFSPSDTGTISFDAPTNPSLPAVKVVEFEVPATVTKEWDAAIGIGTTGVMTAKVEKTGSGTFSAKHFRVNTLDVQAGILRIRDNGSNSGDSTSRVNVLTIGSSAILDLRDNDLVIDYDTTSPIGTPAYNDPGTIAKYVKDGFGGGTWNGSSGLKTSVSAATFSAIGFAEAGSLSISSWQGVAVDTTTVLVRYTFQGDSNVDGTVNINDFSLIASNFNTSQTWYGGDYNYDGTANISDFSLLAANFNVTGRRGGTGLSGLAELYVELLDYPVIYWEARMRPDIWWRFEEFDSMNLGQIPALPEGMRAVPEPVFASVLVIGALAARRRR